MRQILWFRRDLRIEDSAILAAAKNEVLPIFIFDPNILENLPKEDRRVSFIYHSLLRLKKKLKTIGLDLAIFYDAPVKVFTKLKELGIDEVVASIDFDQYAIARDKKIEEILPLKRVQDSFLVHPEEVLKNDGIPYRVFTPFYKSMISAYSDTIEPHVTTKNLKLIPYPTKVPKLEEMGFTEVALPVPLDPYERLRWFKEKITAYQERRDYFSEDTTSKMGIYLRFGLISPKQLLNIMTAWHQEGYNVDFYVRELFWREFYNYILYHFPKSETENFDGTVIPWENDAEKFQKWCDGETGVPIIDAAMREFNQTGWMHNRLRMIVASFLTKNLLIDWKCGEAYFAKYLIDYEAASNVGSWQWAAGTGADAAPYFRIFNPYLQSKKFDPEAHFMKSVMPEFSGMEAKFFHIENGLQQGLFSTYPKSIVDINLSRKRAIEVFKKARDGV